MATGVGVDGFIANLVCMDVFEQVLVRLVGIDNFGSVLLRHRMDCFNVTWQMFEHFTAP